MNLDESVYPSKRVPRPGGDFTVRQFYLPVQLDDTILWALLDTGANVSILPRELARHIMSLRRTDDVDGEYALAGVVNVPYQSYTLDISIMDHIQGTIEELDLSPYTSEEAEATVQLSNVEFQVPTLTWPEIAVSLDGDGEVGVNSKEMRVAILGLHGVIDQINLSFVMDNSVAIQPLENM